MKAIIPVAGAGTKLRPHTYTQPKALIPLAGSTILSVIIDELIEYGIEDFVFIIGYLGDKIKNYVEEHYPTLRTTFVNQNDRRGTGHAILLTEADVGSDPILIVYGDTLCDYDIRSVIDSPSSLIGIKQVESPRKFGVAELGEQNRVAKVIEKPKIPKSNLAIVGIYKIIETPILFEVLKHNLSHTKVSDDGEYHLTDAIQAMIERGVHFEAFKVNNWFDCGQKNALLATNARLLKSEKQEIDWSKEDFKNTVIIPPVRIGKGCIFRNAIIGPSVSVGENTTIHSSVVQDSIIGSFSRLDRVVLKESIIGSDAEVHGLYQSLNIGDNTEIEL